MGGKDCSKWGRWEEKIVLSGVGREEKIAVSGVGREEKIALSGVGGRKRLL